MSIVRQLAKANEKQAKRLRNETSDAANGDEERVAAVRNMMQATDVDKDPIQSMSHTETCLGSVDFERVQLAVSSVVPNKRVKYQKYSDRARYDIGKYGSENGATAAVSKFKKYYPTLNESTVRAMKKRYEELLKNNKTGIIPKAIKKYSVPTGRPLMLGDIDQMVQTYIKAVRARGGHVSYLLAEATAKALIERYPEMNLGHVHVEDTCWARSLFRRMGYTRRAGTTAKVPISDDLKKEVELTFLHDVVYVIEEHNIPPSLVINLDQTPSKYVPGSKSTMAKKGSKNVPIAGMGDKRMITLTFAITLDGTFLPMHLIYGGKTKQSLPRGVRFPNSFSVSFNVKHYSNEKEVLKHLDDVIIPYIEAERERLGLDPDQVALVIMDVFKGQMTDPVFQKLDENHTKVKKVPANFTYLYQPLDAQASVNSETKKFMKNMFTQWYSSEVMKEMDKGKDLATIDIKFKLSTIKPLHAKWLIELYNYFTSPEGKEVCLKGWKVTGIYDAVQMTSKNLPSLDPFADIDPLFDEENDGGNIDATSLKLSQMYVTEYDSDDSDCDFQFGDDDVEVNDHLFEDEDDEEDEDDKDA